MKIIKNIFALMKGPVNGVNVRLGCANGAYKAVGAESSWVAETKEPL